MVRDYLPIIRELRAMHTPRFEGSLSPEVTEELLVTVTRDLEYVQCPHRHRATIASHHLARQARHWWEKVVQEMPEGHRFTWEKFKGEFEQKYYRHQNQEHRFTEFLQLQQGNMTVREYEVEFIRLLIYAGHLVPTERTKIQKFIAGLRPYLQRKIELHEYPTLSRYISQLEKAERGEKEEKEERIRDQSPYRRFFDTRPPGKISQTGQGSQLRDKGKAPAGGALPPSPPHRGPLTCFRCQQLGYFAVNCTTTAEALAAVRPPRPSPRAGVAPRVYVLAAEAEAQEEEADPGEEEDVAITGTLRLCGVECYTLFDTGATHSFLNLEKANTVCTPSEEILPVHGTLRGVSLDICGRDLAADLIVVPIGGYSIILGMDWLSKHRALIDCQMRTIWFMDASGGFEFWGK
ncbi:PREDICTED: uncharacterized protein LOC104810578 [Tarenaya hassleriana]|uniref:uncharacterized protein LOC104810578 n=1 Tax=Tarenaya hassleriana TaxID=28532 RepID=UPI00053C3C4F|nr:PREDICTED: uncharacterized protein LOC104810578 [Tarenaya hassleriana]